MFGVEGQPRQAANLAQQRCRYGVVLAGAVWRKGASEASCRAGHKISVSHDGGFDLLLPRILEAKSICVLKQSNQ